MTTVPGRRAKHAIVTSECRLNRGDQGAAEEAARRLVEEYMACLPGWTNDTKFHFILTIEPASTDYPKDAPLTGVKQV